MAKPRVVRNGDSFRRMPRELSGDLILIVCEGAKTEPAYLKGLRDEWRIHAAQVSVLGEECGSDPLSVVNYAIRLKEQGPANLGRNQYDQVWCVIDQDQHAKLSEALDKATANDIKIALSIPCFEFWYLLHFVYTTRAFRNCAELLKVLKPYLKKRVYEKSKPPIDQLLPRINSAFKHAEKLRKHTMATGTQNPSTQVDLLLIELIRLKAILKERFPQFFS